MLSLVGDAVYSCSSQYSESSKVQFTVAHSSLARQTMSKVGAEVETTKSGTVGLGWCCYATSVRGEVYVRVQMCTCAAVQRKAPNYLGSDSLIRHPCSV